MEQDQGPVLGAVETPVEKPKVGPKGGRSRPEAATLNTSGQESPRWKPEALSLREQVKALEAKLAIWEAIDENTDDGEWTAGRMKKVLSQIRELDVGPTEAALRSWLDRDIKGFEARMRELAAEERNAAAQEEELDRLRREVAELRGKQAEVGGRSAADDLVDSILGPAYPRS